MCELEEDVRHFTYSYELWDVLDTSVTLKRYYATQPGHQKCSYFDRKRNYLKNVDIIHIFLQYLGKVWIFIFMNQRPIRARGISAVPSDPR